MFSLYEELTVNAPLERVFALATRVELVAQNLGMRAVAGVTEGHITAGSHVEWRGWKFGLPTTHRTVISGMVAPHEFARRPEAPDPDTANLEAELERAGYAPLLAAGLQLPVEFEEDAGEILCLAFFQDTQESGRFANFQHDHWFMEHKEPNGRRRQTRMEDFVRFSMPYGAAGEKIGSYLVAPHVRRLMRERFMLLKRLAEGDGWKRWLPALAPQTPDLRRTV